MPRTEALFAEIARDKISAMNKRIVTGRMYCFMQKVSRFYIIDFASSSQEKVRHIREDFAIDFEVLATEQLDIIRRLYGTDRATDETQDLYSVGVVELLSRMKRKGDIFEQASHDLINQGTKLLKAADPNFDNLTFRRELVAQVLRKSDSFYK